MAKLLKNCILNKKALNKIESSVPNVPGWHWKYAEVAAFNKAPVKRRKLDGALDLKGLNPPGRKLVCINNGVDT